MIPSRSAIEATDRSGVLTLLRDALIAEAARVRSVEEAFRGLDPAIWDAGQIARYRMLSAAADIVHLAWAAGADAAIGKKYPTPGWVISIAGQARAALLADIPSSLPTASSGVANADAA